jgi:hypothetical protein
MRRMRLATLARPITAAVSSPWGHLSAPPRSAHRPNSARTATTGQHLGTGTWAGETINQRACQSAPPLACEPSALDTSGTGHVSFCMADGTAPWRNSGHRYPASVRQLRLCRFRADMRLSRWYGCVSIALRVCIAFLLVRWRLRCSARFWCVRCSPFWDTVDLQRND